MTYLSVKSVTESERWLTQLDGIVTVIPNVGTKLVPK